MLRLLSLRSLAPRHRQARFFSAPVITNVPEHKIDLPAISLLGPPQTTLNFDDATNAFRSRSTYQLIRAAVVFRMCRSKTLVKYSNALLRQSYAILGASVTDRVLRGTFFGHFCGGIDAIEMQPVIHELSENGLGAILDYAAEGEEYDPAPMDGGILQTDISARTYDYTSEFKCDTNVSISLQSIADAGNQDGFAAVKITALGDFQLLKRMSSIIMETHRLFHALESPNLSQVKAEYLEKTIDFKTLRQGFKNALATISEEDIVELFNQMDGPSQDGHIDYLDWLSFVNPTDLTMGPLTQFLQVEPLSPAEIIQSNNMLARLDILASAADKHNVGLMVDAEQSYIQPCIDYLVLNLQRKYNTRDKPAPVIFNTFQCYLKDSPLRIRIDLERSRREGFRFAAKLVRGAYMIQERKRARDMAYSDPIYDTIEETHGNYNAMVELLLENHQHGAAFMVASHNEDSVKLTTQRMRDLGIAKKHGGIYFGQLRGMCDHVSYSLGHGGYHVFKYVPYGPIKEVIPYLVRRAEENASLFEGDGARKEAAMLTKEIQRRLLGQA